MQAAKWKATMVKIAKIKKKNQTLADHQKTKFHIKKRQLYINNVPQKPKVLPPTPTDVFNLSDAERQVAMNLKFAESRELRDKSSIFKAYAKPVNSLMEVRKAYTAIRMWHAEADHVMAAYVVPEAQGHCDDGENSAGLKLENQLEEADKKNVVVFVTRVYGYQHLGARRFINILKVSKEALNKVQDIEN